MKTHPLVHGLKEQTKELPETIAPILLVSISAQLIGQSSPSKILPLLNAIAKDWKLNLDNSRHYKIAKKILYNSVQNN